MKHRYTGLIVGIAAGLVLAIAFYAVAAYVAINPGQLDDQFAVWHFKPTAAITEQIQRTDMSAQGKFLYLASRPTVESSTDFNTICGTNASETSVLGCYIQRTKRVYIFHETDARLDGTEEVWAAHEMLRAAWDRMSASDHARLANSLDEVLQTETNSDIDLGTRIGAVESTDPADRDAELYATIGSEVPDAGPVLDKSYDQFFVKRSVETTLAAHARAYLVELKAKVATLVSTISTLGDTIDARIKAFNKSTSALKAAIKSFNQRAVTIGGFSSQAQFDAERAGLLARLRKLKSTGKSIRPQIDEFSADVKQLESLSKSAASLVKGLNIDLSPLPDLSNA